MRRCTRKKPTAGASTPITAPAANASRMNSNSNMHVGRVVPDARQICRRSVEDDRAANEQHALDMAFDSAELVRDVDDCRPELLVQTCEQRREVVLRLDVDARGRLVQDEQRRLGGECLRDEGALLLSSGERLD